MRDSDEVLDSVDRAAGEDARAPVIRRFDRTVVWRIFCGMAQRHIENITLIGFMGTGKSSVGRMVASSLHFQFIDTDELIEERAGRKISEIFEQAGEAGFRQIEKQVVAELARAKRTVISSGGGLAAQPNNLESLKQHSLVVCLWASPEAIWERVHHQSHRPLLQAPDPLARIRELLSAREPFYRQADVLVNTEMRSVKEVAHHVLHQFHAACPRPGAP